MNLKLFFDFTVNKENNTICVKREFAASVDLVWLAWTTPAILDQWWAPKPYLAVTKSMDFREGGMWHYHMLSPEGEKHWCRLDYLKIDPIKCYVAIDAFCDEKANKTSDIPNSTWTNSFIDQGDTTLVDIVISYEKISDLEQILTMGFKEGFTMGMSNLDQYIEMKFKIRNALKTDNKARVCSYLNFPGNTEEVFNFYRKVFQSEFTAPGIQRFGELPADPALPPMADAVKQMVLHVELPILGNHVLMGTDAPKEMGFTVTKGNNMHISLEPETKEEADRIFNELSEGGKISMPLQDMFWGAYFGSFTDVHGINWMINYLMK